MVTLQKPISAPPLPTLPDLPGKVIASSPSLPGADGVSQTSTVVTRGIVRLSVRAWINGRPIFDDEVMQAAGADLARMRALPEPQRSERMAEAQNAVLDHIIDAELMYQDAVKKLEKNAPKTLDKLKDIVDEEYKKSAEKMRKAGMPEDQIRGIEDVAKRMLERNLISQEYARSRIMDAVKARITFTLINDYYQTHRNEYQTVDTIDWQDVFIPVSPNLPSVNDAKRFAEDLLARCRTPDDFNKLMVYNEGPSKGCNGEGLGHRRGEIQPAELEPYLFQLRSGEIGPVVPFPSGVHLVRALKREYAGQLPLDERTQKSIRKKLENQLADREYKRIVRELRSRSVIDILSPGS